MKYTKLDREHWKERSINSKQKLLGDTNEVILVDFQKKEVLFVSRLRKDGNFYQADLVGRSLKQKVIKR